MGAMRTGAALPVGVSVVTLGLCCLFLVSRDHLGLLAVTCWFSIAVLASAMSFYAWRATRLMAPGLPQRRFWNTFAAAGVIFSAGEWAQVAITLADPASTEALTGTGPARTLTLGAGGLALIVVLVRYPLPHRSARDRLCNQLDLAAVITAVGAYGVYWTVTGDWDRHGLLARDLIGVAAGPVLAMLLAFTAGRLYLSGASPFSWYVGVLGPIAAVAEGLARALGPELARAGWPGPIFAMSLCCHAMLMIAAWLQYRRYLSGRISPPATRTRPYSLLPYVALAATYALLLTTLTLDGLDLRAWLILTAAIGSTGVVVARQLVSFIDNARLLAERDALAERLHQMAFTDSLTGLANRAAFVDRLDTALRRADPVGVLLIDLDDFKPVNDRFGHAAGDAVLVEAAARLRARVRPGDLVARLGGDEFAVLLEQPPAGGFAGVADGVVRALGEPCRLPEGELATVRASVGLAVGGAGVGDASSVLKLADQAMYRAKHSGKGSFEVAA